MGDALKGLLFCSSALLLWNPSQPRNWKTIVQIALKMDFSETLPGRCPKKGETLTQGSSAAWSAGQRQRLLPTQDAENGNIASQKPSASVQLARPRLSSC